MSNENQNICEYFQLAHIFFFFFKAPESKIHIDRKIKSRPARDKQEKAGIQATLEAHWVDIGFIQIFEETALSGACSEQRRMAASVSKFETRWY